MRQGNSNAGDVRTKNGVLGCIQLENCKLAENSADKDSWLSDGRVVIDKNGQGQPLQRLGSAYAEWVISGSTYKNGEDST